MMYSITSFRVKHTFIAVIGFLSLNAASSFRSASSKRGSTGINFVILPKSVTVPVATYSKLCLQLHQTIGSNDLNSNLNVLSRRKALIVSTIFFPISAAEPQLTYADVSDGNALPKGAQQFARTLKLKTDVKDVTKRLVSASNDNMIDKKEWDNIGKFLRTVYSTAENDMKEIAKGLSYNPTNQGQALRDVDEIKKYSQAGDVSVSKQDTARLASILAKISELLEDFLSSLSDVPDEI